MVGWLSRDIDNQGLYEFWDREPKIATVSSSPATQIV